MDDYEEGETRPDARPQRENRGILVSPVLDQEDWSCLRLVYQITGSGSLEVRQRREGKSFDRPLWSSQSPSDSWIIASMDLQNTTEPYRVNKTFFNILTTTLTLLAQLLSKYQIYKVLYMPKVMHAPPKKWIILNFLESSIIFLILVG